MKNKNFMKSLLLHIRYPWTAICLLILWVGLAVMCTILSLTNQEITWLVCGAGMATLIIAVVGFGG